jgi:hypothetical protein
MYRLFYILTRHFVVYESGILTISIDKRKQIGIYRYNYTKTQTHDKTSYLLKYKLYSTPRGPIIYRHPTSK